MDCLAPVADRGGRAHGPGSGPAGVFGEAKLRAPHAVQWLGALFVLLAAMLASIQAPETVPAQPERG